MSFIKRGSHGVVTVTDSNGSKRDVCKCQIKEKHITDDEKVNFPVYECPEMTRKYGFGTEEGLQ